MRQAVSVRPVIILFCFLLLVAPAAAEPVTASTETVRLVELFLKTPVADLPPESVDPFLAISENSLPKKLRRRFSIRKIELYSLLHLSKGKKRGNFRVMEDKCEAPRQATGADIGLLMDSGYVEISQDEVSYLTQKTKCTERDMLCEFSLQIRDEAVVVRRKKQVRRRYFLYCGSACDPLMALVAVYREHGKDNSTSFFGIGPTCHR